MDADVEAMYLHIQHMRLSLCTTACTMRALHRRRAYSLVLLVLLTTVIVLKNARQTRNLFTQLQDLEDQAEFLPEGAEDAKNGNEKKESRGSDQRFLIDSSRCQIPDLQAYSTTAHEHSRPALPLHCSHRRSKYRVNRNVKEGRKPVGIDSQVHSLPPGLECCYRHVTRRSRDDNNYKFSQDCMPMDELLAPEDMTDMSATPPEFVRVACHKPGQSEEWINEEYKNLHAFVPLKEDVEFRCDQVPKEKDQVNLVILGIDSVSRLNMLRQLPLTYDILNKPPLSAISLMGYNKVADNTFPNVVPLLTGLSVEELSQHCDWPSSRHSKFDPCPILWKDFASKGFRTMLAEDCPRLSTFNFQKGGFQDPPTDYYPRPFFLAAEDDLGHTHSDNCVLCLGPRSQVATLLDYSAKFVRRFAKERHFAFSWATSLTHDGLNMAGLADAPLSSTIAGMVKRGDLERTVLLVISDHGVRTGNFRLTPQGRIEERLPFAMIAFPPWFESRFPTAVANVRQNAKNRLTTPFDVHETLKDLLQPVKNLDEVKHRTEQLRAHGKVPRGISLFLEIPEDRDCKSAGIPRHWCTCLSYRPLPLNDTSLQDAALAMVAHINERLLAPFVSQGCQPLKLVRVLEARLGTADHTPYSEEQDGIKDYALTVETIPGGALFEGAVKSYRRRGRNNRIRVRFEVADTISRLNRYGNQSACVEDWVAKLYCFCE